MWCDGRVAREREILTEYGIENPRVDGSIPSQATKLKSPFQKWLGLFFGSVFLVESQMITALEPRQLASRHEIGCSVVCKWLLTPRRCLRVTRHSTRTPPSSKQQSKIRGSSKVRSRSGCE